MKAPLMEWIRDRLRSKQPAAPPEKKPASTTRPPSAEELRREEEVRHRIEALDHWAEAVREENKGQQ